MAEYDKQYPNDWLEAHGLSAVDIVFLNQLIRKQKRQKPKSKIQPRGKHNGRIL